MSAQVSACPLVLLFRMSRVFLLYTRFVVFEEPDVVDIVLTGWPIRVQQDAHVFDVRRVLGRSERFLAPRKRLPIL